MATPPLDRTVRGIHPGTARTYWAGPAGVINISTVTRVEMNAMTDLTAEISEATGWEVSANNVAVPDGGSRFTAQVPGRIEPADAAITFYASKDGKDIRTLLHKDDVGFILHMLGGDVPTQPMDVWPVRVRAVSKPLDYAGSNAGMITVQFAVTRVPAEDVLIPALTP